mgnify:CR=1 FL=1
MPEIVWRKMIPRSHITNAGGRFYVGADAKLDYIVNQAEIFLEKEITYKPIRPNPNDPDTGNDVITITSYQFRIWLSVTLTNLSGQSYRAVFRPIAFYTSRKAVASAAQPQGSEQIKASSKPYNETVYCFQNIGAGYPNIIKGDILDQLRIEISL